MATDELKFLLLKFPQLFIENFLEVVNQTN